MKRLVGAVALLVLAGAAQAADTTENCVRTYQALARTQLTCPAFMERMTWTMSICPLDRSIEHVLHGLAESHASNLPDQQAADFLILFIEARRCDALQVP